MVFIDVFCQFLNDDLPIYHLGKIHKDLFEITFELRGPTLSRLRLRVWLLSLSARPLRSLLLLRDGVLDGVLERDRVLL